MRSLVMICGVWGWMVGALGLGGCTITIDEPPIVPVERLVVLHGQSGKETGFEAIVEAAGEADVLILGETHMQATGLDAQSHLWNTVHERYRNAALSHEFLERHDQLWIDSIKQPVSSGDRTSLHLVSSEDDEEVPRLSDAEAPHWWSSIFRYMELHIATESPDFPYVIASNAPRRYVSAYRREGMAAIERMTAEQRRLIVVPEDVAFEVGGRYRRDFDRAMLRAMAGHGGEAGGGMSDEDLDAFYRAQLAWDATMADSIVSRGLDQGYRPVVQVVGRFHSDFDGGLVQYLRHMAPGIEVVTVSLVDAEPPAEGLRAEDVGRADFVVYLRERVGAEGDGDAGPGVPPPGFRGGE